MSSKKRVKPELIDTLMGGSVAKKAKIQPKDPFQDRFADVSVEIPNCGMCDVYSKFFGEGVVNPLKFEVKSYKSELAGTSKTVCGETLFIEETKTSLVITYEKEKKEDFIRILNERFPYCTYSFK